MILSLAKLKNVKKDNLRSLHRPHEVEKLKFHFITDFNKPPHHPTMPQYHSNIKNKNKMQVDGMRGGLPGQGKR